MGWLWWGPVGGWGASDPGFSVRCRIFFVFSSRRRHTRLQGDWSSDVCSSDLLRREHGQALAHPEQTFVGVTQVGAPAAGLRRGKGEHPGKLDGRSRILACRNKTEEIGRASCRERV